MNSLGRLHHATETCTIKRVALSTNNGTTDLAALHIADIPCTPLLPRTTGLFSAGRPQAEYMADVIQYQVFVFDIYDIKKGDTLVLNGSEYPIWDVQPWKVKKPFMVIILNDVQAVKPTEAEFIR